MRSFSRTFFFSCFLLISNHLCGQWQLVNAPGIVRHGDLMVAQGQFFVFQKSVFVELSRSDDQGLTWHRVQMPTNNSVTEVQSDGSNLYCLTKNLTPDPPHLQVFDIYVSPDLGQTWSKIATPAAMQGVPSSFANKFWTLDSGELFFSTQIATFRRDPATAFWAIIQNQEVYAVTRNGADLWISSPTGLSKSGDDGQTWQVVQPNWPSSHEMAAANGVLVSSTNLGVFRSADDGQIWQTVANFPKVVVRRIDNQIFLLSESSPEIWLSSDGFLSHSVIFENQGGPFSQPVSYQSANGFQIVTTRAEILRAPIGSSDWKWCGTGIGQNSVAPLHLKSAGDLIFTTDQYDVASFTKNNGGFWQSSNPLLGLRHIVKKGDTYFMLNAFLPDSLFVSKDLLAWEVVVPDLGLSGVHTFLVDGNDLVAMETFVQGGSSRLYRSKDDGLTWTFEGLSTFDPAFTNWVFALDGKKNMYQIEFPTQVLYSPDFGMTWSILPIPNQSPNVSIAAKSGKVYLTDNQNFISFSADAGQNWTVFVPIFQGFQAGEVVIAQIYAASNGLYAFDKIRGAFFSPDDGQNFFPAGSGLPTVFPSGGFEIAENKTGIFLSGSDGKIYFREKSGLLFSEFSGTAYFDKNDNGQQDFGENPMKGLVIYTKNGENGAISGTDGQFAFSAEKTNDSLLAVRPALFSKINPSGYAVSQSDSLKNFGVFFTPGIRDLSIFATNINVFRPGFETLVHLASTNLGSETMDGMVVFDFPNWLEVLEISPAPTSKTDEEIVWDFTNLNPLEHLNFSIKFKTPVSTTLGSAVELSAKISPTVGDENPTNNFDRISTTVVGSFDPNDKSVSPKNYSPDSLLAGVPLVYTVRFQNTGNYPASFVTVLDTLSENLDWKTLEVLAASHDYSWKISGRGIVEFNFEGINLPDSVANEPESHGFIKFSVKPKANLSLGDFVANTAFIYFDYNDPVVTNTVKSTIELISWVGNPENFHQISISPNPASDFAEAVFPEILEKGSILKVFSGNGKLVQEVLAVGNRAKIDVEKLPAGSYFLICKTVGKVFSGKLTVLRR